MSLAADLATPQTSASSSTQAWFALPSAGGAVTAIFHSPPTLPTTRRRFAPGCTRNVIRPTKRQLYRARYTHNLYAT